MDDELTIPPLHLGSAAWAIRREVLPRIIEAHRTAILPGSQAIAEQLASASPKAARRSTGVRAGGAVAVLPLTGVITPRGSFLSMIFGSGCGGLQGFREDFRDAVASPDVGAIIIDIDSPGGLIDLVPETACEIREARGSKPIIAIANTTAASAAFWIAAQADELVVTPSGTVGSVGVYMVHEDWSGYNEKLGLDPTYISAGRYKTEGNPDEPLDEAAQADWQAEVDGLYETFVNEIATGRGCSAQDVLDNYGDGRTLRAAAALSAGMVDRVDTIEAVIASLLDPGANGKSSAQSARLISTGRAVNAKDNDDDDDDDEDEDDDEKPGLPDDDDDDADDNPAPKATLDRDARAAIAAVLI